MTAVSRVAEEDRLPFLRALAYIATVDDSVSIDEKQLVMQYAESWNLDDDAQGGVRDILRSGSDLSLSKLVSQFSEAGTRFLLVQELVRLSHADGTYGNAEKEAVAEIARRMDLDENQLQDVEEWVERGRAWGTEEDDELGPDEEDLENVIDRQEDSEHDLSDIDTDDTDLSDL